MNSLLAGSHPLDDGTRVRLRLARGSDAGALRELLTRAGEDAERVLHGLVHFDPRSRSVLCATALIDGRETIVAAGSIQTNTRTGPELLVADERRAAGVGALLGEALLARAA